jgi:hypothetical protein
MNATEANIEGLYDFDTIVREMGGSEYHLTGRERARMRVRIRDGFKCRNCKAFRSIRQVAKHNSRLPTAKGGIKLFDVHHLGGQCGKNSRGYDAVSDISKLITLCHSCHFKHHQFSKRINGEWSEVPIPAIPLYQWGLTKEELQIKAPHGI